MIFRVIVILSAFKDFMNKARKFIIEFLDQSIFIEEVNK